VRFENLFASSSYSSSFSLPFISSSATAFLGTGTNSDRIAGFYATLSFVNYDPSSGNNSPFRGKPGVTYAVERATLDAAGNTGAYAAVTLSSTSTIATALPTGALIADVLGYVPVTGVNYSGDVYDRDLPAADGKFRYRIKAVKGAVTQTQDLPESYYSSSPVTVTADPYNAISSVSITIAAATTDGTGTKTYAVTPRLAPKGVLQTGDKLVFYYVKGAADSAHTTGPYAKGPEFSKAELEAATVAPQNLVIAKVTAGASPDAYAYVQAYIEQASGQRTNISSYISGDGVSSGYYDYAQLDY
jgi:hypothetical protein